VDSVVDELCTGCEVAWIKQGYAQIEMTMEINVSCALWITMTSKPGAGEAIAIAARAIS
jgi:hypothetical protein